MCTSFIFRGNDTLIGMNYDNHGMNFHLEPYNANRFIISMKAWGKSRPLLGVRADGIFANQQVINTCDSGHFRLGLHVVHTSQLIGYILSGKISSYNIGKYLSCHTVVNPPKQSLHSMIADVNGEGWIVEPGRGNVCYDKDTHFFVMSNCPIYGVANGKWEGFGVKRQTTAQCILEKADKHFDVQDAFRVLQAVQQTEGDWITEISLVYSALENAVYYCFNHNYGEIKKYQMKLDGC